MTENTHDDDFEDLFSFGAEASSTAMTSTAASAASISDFDMLNSIDLSGTAATSGATAFPAKDPVKDDFEDLFGTPPGTLAAPKLSLDLLNSRSALPNPDLNTVASQQQTMSIDDFHVHDAGTRDFLEWLDDDTGKNREGEMAVQSNDDGVDISLDFSGEGGESNLHRSGGQSKAEDPEEDDFDFDRILAEADVAPSKLGGSQRKTMMTTVAGPMHRNGQVQLSHHHINEVVKNKSSDDVFIEPNVAKEAVACAEPTTKNAFNFSSAVIETSASAESSNSLRSSGTVTPEPTSKPYAPACIEEELSFDQWDDNVGADQLHIAGTDGDDSTNNPAAKDVDSVPTGSSKSGSSVGLPTKVSFNSLSEAIRSNLATVDDVRALFAREQGRSNIQNAAGVSLQDRPYLWTKVVCGKILAELDNGSLAESFREWKIKNETNQNYGSDESTAAIEKLLLEAGNSNQGSFEDLLSVLMFHNNSSSGTEKSDPSSTSIDPLFPPVANAILQSGIPPAAATVVLSQIEPMSMPLLRLSQNERFSAVKALHTDFHLLACYHLPLLIMHLDRHCPGWYWAAPYTNAAEKSVQVSRNEKVNSGDALESDDSANAELVSPEKSKDAAESGGLVPLSWFVTNFAGELGKSCLDHKVLLPLWDHLLTVGDCSRKFFLAIAVLDKHSDTLLMSRGEELRRELEKVLNFKATSFDEESFVGAHRREESLKTDDESNTIVFEWLNLAQSMFECTPSSVINMLRSADDRAVADALHARKAALDEKAEAQLDAQQDAMKKEREEREAQAKMALMKARLVAYYRNHNPEKVDTIDQIYNMFDGRFEVLNEKLKKKYGQGFLPEEPVKEHVSNQARNFLVSVNQSIYETRKHVATTVAERRKRTTRSSSNSMNQMKNRVALDVSPTEIIPHVCSTKGHNPVTGEKWSVSSDTRLKFYLIDCRPEGLAKEQGRFPTAVNMGPKMLQDPDELQKLTDMFESLRGAVHICVMGEGFSSFPALYDHPLTDNEQKLLEDDISRTSSCCLFFLKKGFPFVSILKGGFAAAHAFLWRNGPDLGIPPSNVLVDYDPLASLFAQLEIAHQEQEEYMNASARDKTTKTLQKIIDSSMARLTLEEQRINSLASDLTRPENVEKMKQSMSNLFKRPVLSQKVATAGITFSKKFSSSKSVEFHDKLTTEEEPQKLTSIAIFTEKMKFKRWHSESNEISKGDESNDLEGCKQNENVLILDSEAKGDLALPNNVATGDRLEEVCMCAQNESAVVSECESKHESMTVSTQSMDSVVHEQEYTESVTSKLSQFRLKMGLSIAETKLSDNQNCAREKTQLKIPFSSFLKKPVLQTNPGADRESEQEADGLNTEEKSEINVVQSKLASFTKQNPFANFLHKRDLSEEKNVPDQKESDSNANLAEQDLVPPSPTSPVKSTFDNFAKSLEAGLSSANKILSEISEHDDPFHPKNDRPMKTRFGVYKRAGPEPPTTKSQSNGEAELLLLMEEHDNGHEDEIDFSEATNSSKLVQNYSDPFEEAAQSVVNPVDDLFRGLVAQPDGDPTENLFDDLMEEERKFGVNPN
ncbi:hypothetical protein ACHAW6_007320 [Cyclotella cf. meneghiniana]